MCKHCGPGSEVPFAKSDDYVLFITADDAKLGLHHEVSNNSVYQVTFYINFCPMCGRKLGEEDA